MQLNFFTWIRDGVRQAVLLGVSDAVDHLGNSPMGDDLGQRLALALRPDPAAANIETMDATPKRRRLGRSLKDG